MVRCAPARTGRRARSSAGKRLKRRTDKGRKEKRGRGREGGGEVSMPSHQFTFEYMYFIAAGAPCVLGCACVKSCIRVHVAVNISFFVACSSWMCV